MADAARYAQVFGREFGPVVFERGYGYGRGHLEARNEARAPRGT